MRLDRLPFLFLLLALCISAILPAQGLRPYNPTKATNGILLGLGGTITATSMYLDRRIPELTEEDVVAWISTASRPSTVTRRGTFR